MPEPRKARGKTVPIKLSADEREALEEKAKGTPLDVFLKSVVVSASKAPKKGGGVRPKAAPPENAKVTVLGPFGMREATVGELRRETETHNIRAMVLDELLSTTDRAAAIVGSAFVDKGLELLMRACWKGAPGDPKASAVANEFFDHHGGLGLFSSRISAAYLSGLIGQRTFYDLTSIREIRNKCAHWTTMADDRRVKHDDKRLSFDHALISNLCSGLWTASKSEIEFIDGTRLRATTPRNQFTLTIIELSQQLHGCAELVSKGMPAAHVVRYLP